MLVVTVNPLNCNPCRITFDELVSDEAELKIAGTPLDPRIRMPLGALLSEKPEYVPLSTRMISPATSVYFPSTAWTEFNGDEAEVPVFAADPEAVVNVSSLVSPSLT